MQTERLYYQDAYLTEADATVLSCAQEAGGWLVTLDRTVFYPTGGGQPCDLGTLGDTEVSDVCEKGGQLLHLCSRPVEPGQRVHLRIDRDRRFTFMQQHSAEHIVSGTIHTLYGLNNVGFHMGSHAVTIDFDGELNEAQLREITKRANRIIWENLPIRCFFPSTDALQSYKYRSKKELTDKVRLVSIPGTDLCACCGLHVAHTGRIGMIRLNNPVRFRGGTRMELLCSQALADYYDVLATQATSVSAQLSAKPEALAAAVARLCEERASEAQKAAALEQKLFSLRARQLTGQDSVVLFEENLSPDGLRRFADILLRHGVLRCAVFSGENDTWRYALGTQSDDLRETVRQLNASFQGRGGGKPHFVQGSLRGSREALESFFAALWGGIR